MYCNVAQIFSRYWRAYGGLSSLLRSPYFHLSIFLSLLTGHIWNNEAWWEQVISTLPNLLGFTLAGFSMFIGFGDERFRSMLADPDEGEVEQRDQPTIYLALCSTFVHFIVVQIVALLYAIVAKALWFHVPCLDSVREYLQILRFFAWGFGYLLFLYALTSALAATMHVFRIASMYEQFRRFDSKKSEDKTE